MPALVVLSPHLDDALINCFHAIHVQKALVTTVFSGVPRSRVNKLWDILGGESDGSRMMLKRRQEDIRALKLISPESPIHLNFLDHQYASGDRPSIEEMAKEIITKAPAGCVFLAPLAASRVRRHPDHILIREIGLYLRKQGHEVRFYPDSPYMFLPKVLNPRAGNKLRQTAASMLGGAVEISMYKLRPAETQLKCRALHMYKSQYRLVNINSLGGLTRVCRRNYEIIINQSAS
ncbi:MAG TPA: PIG-L family deacetylase [Candidatus Saccharimonadales bacterium]|nr:PIG-L family deacetylase [Candidatus Saccharimonadales bacterium]